MSGTLLRILAGASVRAETQPMAESGAHRSLEGPSVAATVHTAPANPIAGRSLRPVHTMTVPMQPSPGLKPPSPFEFVSILSVVAIAGYGTGALLMMYRCVRRGVAEDYVGHAVRQ
jgi:hypothetical protein